jgi:hypothetical protein
MSLLLLFTPSAPLVIVAPTVVTNLASGIGQTEALGNGSITATGGESPSIRGIQYNTVAAADKTAYETGTFSAGSFQETLEGLTPGQTYFFRAFATNSGGTGYGTWESFVAASSEYAVTIDGIDRTADILNQTIRVSDQLNDQVNTCSFSLMDLSGNGIPVTDDEITIVLPDGTLFFSGYVLKRGLSKSRSGQIVAHLDCVDQVRLFDRNLVNQAYIGMTDKEIIEDIVATCCAGFGITTTNVIEGVTIDQISFNYVQPSQALRRISDLTGRNWYIDYQKDVHYFPIDTNPAPFDITDSDEAVTIDYIREDMTTAPAGTLKGAATYIGASAYVQVTQAVNDRYGYLEYSSALAPVFTVEFDFTTGGGTGADAIWFYWGASITPIVEEIPAGYGGYIVDYDEYRDQIELWFDGTMLTAVAQAGIDNNVKRNAKIIVNGSNIKVYLDGVLKIDYTDIGRTLAGTLCGVGARTGSLNNEHQLNSLNVYSTATTMSATDYKDLKISADASQLKNRVYVRGGTKLSDITAYEEKGDGTKIKYVLPDKPHDVTVKVNGVTKTLGIKNIDTSGFDFYLNFEEKYVEQDSGGVVLTSTDTLRVEYSYDIPILVAVEDTASIIENGQREFPIFDKTITTQDQARARASAELTDYANDLVEGSFSTFTTGFRSGQFITITKAEYDVDAQYIVKSVTASAFGAGHYKYQVTLASAKTMGIIRFLIELLEANSKLVEVNDDEVVDNLLSIADTLNSDSLLDNLTIDSAGPYATWCTDSLQVSPITRMRWDLFQWG